MFQLGLEWPIAFLDFEASALDDMSYPIEAGVAIWKGPTADIVTWSSLIEPAPQWVRDGVWFEAAQKIHGIAPRDLVGAAGPHAVMTRLNELLGPVGTVISDNRDWERQWLQTLSDAAGVKREFEVTGVADRLMDMAPGDRMRMTDHLRGTPTPHRARADAARWIEAMAVGLRLHPTRVDMD